MKDDDRFWKELRKNLTRIIRFRCPHASAEWREDAVQNTLVRIIRLLETEKKKKEDISTAYARHVAFSTVVNMWSAQNARPEDLLEQESLDAVRSHDLDPEEHVRRLELGRLIEQLLARLSPERRLAVQLCVLQGHKVPEAASILGFSRKKTENLVHRGRQQLRQWLAEELGDEHLAGGGARTLLGWIGR